MEKSYILNGKRFDFINVHFESGCLYGYCKAVNKNAWLDNNGFQFEYEKRVEAIQANSLPSFCIPPNCHCWGGEIRNNTTWRKQW